MKYAKLILISTYLFLIPGLKAQHVMIDNITDGQFLSPKYESEVDIDGNMTLQVYLIGYELMNTLKVKVNGSIYLSYGASQLQNEILVDVNFEAGANEISVEYSCINPECNQSENTTIWCITFVEPLKPGDLDIDAGYNDDPVSIDWQFYNWEVEYGQCQSPQPFYRVWRSDSPEAYGEGWQNLTGWISSTSFFDHNTNPGDCYYYFVEISPIVNGTFDSGFLHFEAGWTTTQLVCPVQLTFSNESQSYFEILSSNSNVFVVDSPEWLTATVVNNQLSIDIENNLSDNSRMGVVHLSVGGECYSSDCFLEVNQDEGCSTPGCMNAAACNYSCLATCDDGSCNFDCMGCTYSEAGNYDSLATMDDGSCVFPCAGDLDFDLNVGTGDLLIFLGVFGSDCQ